MSWTSSSWTEDLNIESRKLCPQVQQSEAKGRKKTAKGSCLPPHWIKEETENCTLRKTGGHLC